MDATFLFLSLSNPYMHRLSFATVLKRQQQSDFPLHPAVLYAGDEERI
jgi:hypothetical protein